MIELDDHDAVNREVNETNDALHGLRGSVDALRGVLSAREGKFALSAIPQQTHVRMIAKRLVFSVSAACTVTFTFGNLTYAFDTAGPLTIDLPAPTTIIERGVNMSVAVSAGVLRIAYLTYDPE